MGRKYLVEGKTLIQSKTFWFNVLMVISMIISVVGVDYMPSEHTAEVIALIGSIINIYLRTVTEEPITKIK